MAENGRLSGLKNVGVTWNVFYRFKMKRITILLILFNISLIQYGQIIADHTVVDKFDAIPQEYIDKVKAMWVVVAGESHSQAYRTGLLLLESLDSRYAASVIEGGTPEGYTTSNLRASRATWGDLATLHLAGYIATEKRIGAPIQLRLSSTKAGIAIL